jgi:hypothetical protein
MQQLLETLHQWKNYIMDVEKIYATLKANGEPNIQEVMLPLLYKHLSQQDPFQNSEFTSFLGAYLSRRHPHLREYFLNQRTQQELESILEVLERHGEDQNA